MYSLGRSDLHEEGQEKLSEHYTWSSPQENPLWMLSNHKNLKKKNK